MALKPRSFFFKDLTNVASEASFAKKLPSMQGVRFGTIFSPHMLEVEGTTAGWKGPVIKDFQNLKIRPGAQALQHGLQCFEGLKAYVGQKGEIRLFRPDMNARRMLNAFERLQFPSFEVDEFVACLQELVRIDKGWVPKEEQHSLYIRPCGIATSGSISPRTPIDFKLFIITSPVGPYYPSGFKPVKLAVETSSHRAWPGGHGAYKVGPNYASVMALQNAYALKGYSQILWLGPKNVVDEVGAMNFMMLWRNKEGERELITAPLDGTILPGITRDSILALCRDWGEFRVSEKRFTMEDVVEGFRENRVEEMFGCGTAAIVTTVESLSWKGEEFKVPTPEKGVALRALRAIVDIQTGKTEHPWSIHVPGT